MVMAFDTSDGICSMIVMMAFGELLTRISLVAFVKHLWHHHVSIVSTIIIVFTIVVVNLIIMLSSSDLMLLETILQVGWLSSLYSIT